MSPLSLFSRVVASKWPETGLFHKVHRISLAMMATIASSHRQRVLTGDTPTGRLHLGHWVGSVQKRLEFQETHDFFCIIANAHAFTTRAHDPNAIRQSVLDITLDYLAAGINPDKSTIFIQSEVPAIMELTFFLSMLIPHARVLRNPTLKEELRDKGMEENYPFGFLLYPVGQMADILAFRPESVPVGEDQLPHIEMTREVARRFNQLYCDVPSDLPDAEQIQRGGLFPIPQPIVGRVKRLIGLLPPDAEGRFKKMSKSLGNAIYLCDSPEMIRKKVSQMYTDPLRIKATDPGRTENNPLWIYHEIFNPDKVWVEEAKERYRKGQIGDVECKTKLAEALIALTEPMRQRRQQWEKDPQKVLKVLAQGTEKANAIAEETLRLVKIKMCQDYFSRSLSIKA